MTAGGGIRVELLGRLAVWQGGTPLPSLPAQPKRLALLAYLLLRRRGEAVRRDELAGVFWPDSTEARARASLRQALRFLRTQLGEDCLEARGDVAIATRPRAISCDALDVARALAERDDRRAAEAYGGELMPGFSVSGCSEFNDWLEAERARLHRAVVQVHLRLAEAAQARGRRVDAAGHLARAVELAPGDDDLVRRLAFLNTAQDAIQLHGPLNPQRVLVVEFENLTGDPTLAVLGRLAADTVSQALAEVAEIDVAPPLALRAPGVAQGTPAETARRMGARITVEGSYYRRGDTLHWQVRYTDLAAERLLPAPPLVTGSLHEPEEGIMRLREAVVRTLAPALSTRAIHARHAAPPPSLPAYSAYVRGLDDFVRGEWHGALEAFRHAVGLEPAYALPRVVSAIALWNLGDLRGAKAAADEAARSVATLSRFDRAVLDMVRGWLAGDWAAAYRADRVQAELAPTSIPHFQVAEDARRLNRPRETIAVLSQLDPEEGELRGWIYYWTELTTAHHMLGEHRRELALAQRCAELHPGTPTACMLAARALAALGQPEDAVAAAERALALPGPRDPSAGAILLEAALEARAHGHAAAAGLLLDRAVLQAAEEAEEAASPLVLHRLACCRYHAGQLEQAREIFERLAAARDRTTHPLRHLHAPLQAQLAEGYLLVIATRQEREAEAAGLRERLRALDASFLFGAPSFWLAADAALRTQREEAVRFLRRAFADGLPHELFLHADPHFLELRGFPPFDALMRPAG